MSIFNQTSWPVNSNFLNCLLFSSSTATTMALRPPSVLLLITEAAYSLVIMTYSYPIHIHSPHWEDELDCVTPQLKSLQWLPVPLKIKSKLPSRPCKAIQELISAFLCSPISVPCPTLHHFPLCFPVIKNFFLTSRDFYTMLLLSGKNITQWNRAQVKSWFWTESQIITFIGIEGRWCVSATPQKTVVETKSLENTEFEGEMIAVCKCLKSCHMKERLQFVFFFLKGRTDQCQEP